MENDPNSYRGPVTAEDVYRAKQAAKRALPPPSTSNSAFALSETTNLPAKRQCFDSSTPSGYVVARDNVQKEIRVAPDWGGNETTSTQDQVPKMLPPLPLPPVSTVYRPSNNPLNLSHRKWGIKRDVVMGFKNCGVEEMYPWQAECLSQPGLLKGDNNIVYTAPTSAGKSLVADILAIKSVLERGKKAIIVLPYVAIVQEKTRFLKKVLETVRIQVLKRMEGDRPMWRPLNVAGFHSGVTHRIGWQELDIAVCTIEKANGFVNCAIEDCSIDRLGVVVFDELHMLDDQHRGYILELLAAKLLCLPEMKIQIVGMSATLSNVRTLATWLSASFYESTHRPVPLQERIVVENSIYNNEYTLCARVPLSEVKELKDPVTNSIVALAFGAVVAGHGVLVFCETRRRCENLAQLLVRFMPRGDEELREKRMEIVRDLATTATGLDFTLERTVCSGVAFHHAGLTTEERDLISNGYDKGLIKVICCTATMAAGVNLPARRVILSPRMGRDFVSPSMLRQMRGRAGRKGRDTSGESFLCCRKEDLEKVKELMNAPMPEVKSCLTGDTNGLKRAILEVIATRLATSNYSLDEYIRSTLLFHTTPDPETTLPPLVGASIASLKENELITINDSTGYFKATKIGRATVASGFGPDEGVFMHNELSRALKNFNLESDMHIVYQFTPIHSSSAAQGVEVDWKLLREEVDKLDESGLRSAAFIGVNPGFVNRMANGGTLKENTPENIEKARVYRRFYVSLMLRELINERPVHVVAANYEVARGFIQQLATNSRGFASTSATFCKVMGWTGLGVLLEHYAWRLDFGVKDDLMGLARLPFVKSYTARLFHGKGLKTIAAVAAASVGELTDILYLAQPKKMRLKNDEEGKLRARLLDRAAIISKVAGKFYAQEQQDVELEEY